MLVITSIIFSIISILCLCIGFFAGFKIGKMISTEAKETTVEKAPKIKTEKISKEEKIKYEEQMKKLEQIWENASNYDGTSKNQVKV